MKRINKVLVLGGSGYIGSHMCQLLLDKKLSPVIFDLRKPSLKKIPYIQGDLKNENDIVNAVKKVKPDLIMYFAGLIIAPESTKEPVKYFEDNVKAAVHVIKAVKLASVKHLIFSSTAAVYGNPKKVPITENEELAPINTYGYTKLMFEQMLHCMAMANKDFNYIALRYFNAAGAHCLGHLGENHEPETHLIPNILRAIKGQIPQMTIYGKDYDTPDGTCIRDYIHVEDLAEAHFLAIKALDNKKGTNTAYNLGSGRGFSVNQIIRMAERVTGKKVPYVFGPRREGDPGQLIASSKKANKVLGWKAKRSLEIIMKSAWAWEQKLDDAR